MRLPLLVLHIAAGTLGMLSGFVAVFLRKGSRRHGITGNVFVISMLTMSACGAILAIMKSQPGNILGGSITFYLVATAWLAARRKEGKPGPLDWAAFFAVSTLAAFELTFGLNAAMSPTGMKFGYPPGPYFFMGSVAALAAVGDIRMFLRGGISGAKRIARHLWRMCFALFVAAGSIFLARAHLFPAIMRKTGTLWILSFLPLALLVYWMVRVLFTRYLARVPAQKPAAKIAPELSHASAYRVNQTVPVR